MDPPPRLWGMGQGSSGDVLNRFEFGLLVASLRDDMHWTRQELAARSDVSLSVIRSIERGERKTLLKDGILQKLADGLHLTSMERMEFIFAASGVAETDIFRGRDEQHASFDSGAFLREAGEQIARLALPAFISDPFCDIVLANHCTLALYNIPAELVSSAGSIISGFNMMRYIFDPRSNFFDLTNEKTWERPAVVNAHYFRKRTMRVRSKLYFTQLLAELLDQQKYPAFERYWRKILFEDHDEYSHPFYIVAPQGAHEFITVETLFALTPHGELYLQQLLPMNRLTADRFALIAQKAGEGYELFAPFPDKRKS